MFTVFSLAGLIPARAGKTPVSGWVLYMLQAHPRAGGENCERAARGDECRGSSPRGRGKLRERHPTNTPARLIPARAGKTGRAAHSPAGLAAHPRAGGENEESWI